MRYAWLLALLLAAMAAIAQPEIGGNPDVPKPMVYVNLRSMVMKTTEQGLFIAYQGMLAKYDAKTLKPLGTLKLMELPPQPPNPYIRTLPGRPIIQDGAGAAAIAKPAAPDPAAVEAFTRWQALRQALMSPPAVLATPDSLLIVITDRFFRVDQAKFTVEAKAELAQDAGGARVAIGGAGQTPVVELNGATLYVVSGRTVWSLDTITGKVFGKADLPDDLLALPVAKPLPIGGGPIVDLPVARPMPMPMPPVAAPDGAPVVKLPVVGGVALPAVPEDLLQ